MKQNFRAVRVDICGFTMTKENFVTLEKKNCWKFGDSVSLPATQVAKALVCSIPFCIYIFKLCFYKLELRIIKIILSKVPSITNLQWVQQLKISGNILKHPHLYCECFFCSTVLGWFENIAVDPTVEEKRLLAPPPNCFFLRPGS